MRALSSDRLPRATAAGRRRRQEQRAPAAKPIRSRRAVTRRRPPPAWLRPALAAVAALLAVALLAIGAYRLWQERLPNRMAAWFQAVAEEAQIAARFTVQEVTAQGRRLTPREALIAALEVEKGRPLLSVDLDAARARIEALGWVRQAAVSRRFPDSIAVRIAERRPMALWQQGGRLALVAEDGAVMTTRGLARFRGLPLIVGPEAPHHAQALLAVLKREPDLFRQVEAAVHVGGRRWDLRMTNGLVVKLPAGDQASAWQRFAALERNYEILSREIAGIDLRIAGRIAVKLAPGVATRFWQPGKRT